MLNDKLDLVFRECYPAIKPDDEETMNMMAQCPDVFNALLVELTKFMRCLRLAIESNQLRHFFWAEFFYALN